MTGVTGESRQYSGGRILPIDLDDEGIRAAVETAELPPLLAALAMVTGDLSILEDGVRPPLPPMDASISPQGGLDEAAQARARELAVAAIIRLRDGATAADPEPSDEHLAVIMRFLTKNAGDEYLPLLGHELAHPRDVGTPDWTLSDVSPGDDFRVAVIGAGITGLAAAHRLAQAGVPYVVFEKNQRVGGTWHENVYPGCRLDTPNFAYSFSFAQKTDWPEQFSTQAQIETYLGTVAQDFGLDEQVRFGCEVVSAIYQDDDHAWELTIQDATGARSVQRFNAVMTAVGQLNRPALPDIPGRESFAGHAFHSARWDRSVDTRGLRIAVIGTGASAYQIVPSVAAEAGSLTVFQRNAPWMLPTPNYHEGTPEGMQWLLHHVPFYGRWVRFWQFWLAAEGRLPFVVADPEWTGDRSTSAPNDLLRRQLTESIERQTADDPELRAKMIPSYPPGSKRMTRDNGAWVEALTRDNVELVTDGIERITETGIVTVDGTEREFDLIVYATGFQASDYLAPITVRGLEGRDLHEYWGGDARAYLGINVPGFPNLFMLMGPNTGVVVNGSSLFMGECTAEYSVGAIGTMLAAGARAIDCTPEATDGFVEWVDAGNQRRAWGVATVSSWYRNSLGRASQVWPYSLREFYDRTRRLVPGAYRFLGTDTDVRGSDVREPEKEPVS